MGLRFKVRVMVRGVRGSGKPSLRVGDSLDVNAAAREADPWLP